MDPFTAMAVIGTGVSLYEGYQARKDAKKSRSLQAQQLDLQRETAEKTEAGINDYRDYLTNYDQEMTERFGGIEDELAQTVQDGIDVEGRAREAGIDAGNTFDASLNAQRRSLQRRGINPLSSAAGGLEEDANYERTRAILQQTNAARTTAQDQDFARKLAFANMGQGAKARVMQGMGSIPGMYNGVSAQQGVVGQGYGQQADASAQSYNESLGIAGKLLGVATRDQGAPATVPTDDATGNAIGVGGTPVTRSRGILQQEEGGRLGGYDFQTDTRLGSYGAREAAKRP